MGNLVTYVDSNSNSYILKFCNIFQVTTLMCIHVRQFLQQLDEIGKVIIVSIKQRNLRCKDYFTVLSYSLVSSRLCLY